jgi:hypothetical protein
MIRQVSFLFLHSTFELPCRMVYRMTNWYDMIPIKLVFIQLRHY